MKSALAGFALLVVIGLALLASCQRTTEVTPVSASSIKQDGWQKMKECADQAERVSADYQRLKLPMGATPGSNWADHYNTRENRCFIELWYVTIGSDRSRPLTIRNVTVHALQDAFERKTIAQWADNGCEIGDQETDCTKTLEFISEHMKN